jgi:hypothetical protein
MTKMAKLKQSIMEHKVNNIEPCSWYGTDKKGHTQYVCSLVWGKMDAIKFAQVKGLRDVRIRGKHEIQF